MAKLALCNSGIIDCLKNIVKSVVEVTSLRLMRTLKGAATRAATRGQSWRFAATVIFIAWLLLGTVPNFCYYFSQEVNL